MILSFGKRKLLQLNLNWFRKSTLHFFKQKKFQFGASLGQKLNKLYLVRRELETNFLETYAKKWEYKIAKNERTSIIIVFLLTTNYTEKQLI